MPVCPRTHVRTLTLLGLLLLGACGQATDAGPRSVTVEFENAVQGGHQRYLVIDDLTVAGTPATAYDLGLASDRPAGMLIEANGTRNLAHVGTGSEAAFRRLAEEFASWSLRDVPAAAEQAGLVQGESRADYWTPAQHFVQPGTVLAVRRDPPAPLRDAESSPRDVKALVFVQSIGARDRLVLLVARAP